MNSIFLYMIYLSCIAIECMISTLLYIFFLYAASKTDALIVPYNIHISIPPFLSILSILHSLCLAHWYCVFMWISFLCISLYFINPLLSVSFLYFAVNLHRRFWITLFYHHFVYKTCSVFFLYILWNIMHWSRGTWLYIFLFIELSWKKNWQRQLIYYHVSIIRYSTYSFGGKIFLNTNVRECDIGFQNTCILFHE